MLIDNEVYSKVKDYSKERNRVITYYEIGRILYEAGNKYGESIIKNYSIRLVSEVGKKYNERTLRRICQFFITFSNQNWSPMATKSLSWSHIIELLPLKDRNMINYYISISLNENLSRNDFRRRIKSKEYERLDNDTKIN